MVMVAFTSKMAENVSWLKKPSAMPSRRSNHIQNLVEINSTLTMNQVEVEKIYKPPKRKSCLMFQERRPIQQVPSEKKAVKTKGQSNTEFRNRTLQMVQGRLSTAPTRKSLAPRRPFQLAPRPRAPEVQLRDTPLHKSTPCEPHRSILKSCADIPRILSSKKVNFDSAAIEEGVFPLQDSTIQNSMQLDTRKVMPSNVDVGTNTDEYMVTDVQNDKVLEKENQILVLFKKMENNIVEKMRMLETKIDLIAKNSCSCKAPSFYTNQANAIKKYMTCLDDIGEDSENVTPNLQEKSENSTPHPQEPADNVTPQLTHHPLKERLIEMEPDYTAPPEVKVTVCHDTIVEQPTVPEENDEPATEDDALMKIGPQRRSARLLGITSPAEPVQTTNKLRNIRKRTIPRYLTSFELSPKAKSNLK